MFSQKVGDEVIAPIKPTFFDKAKLQTDEFKNHIYIIEFKKSKKKVRDMALSGYIHAIYPYLKSIESEVLHYGIPPGRNALSAVVRCTITVSFKTSVHGTPSVNDMKFSALGDGDITDVPSAGTLIRTVETRALKRAIARALDISKVDFNEEFVPEDEIGSPMFVADESHGGDRLTPLQKALDRRRVEEDVEVEKAEREAELDEELDRAARDPHSGSTDSDW